MGSIIARGGLAALFTAVVATVGFGDEVRVDANKVDEQQVALVVTDNNDTVWKTVLPCQTINRMPNVHLEGMVRGYASDAFEEVVHSERRREDFKDNLRLLSGAAVNEAAHMCGKPNILAY